MKIDLTGQRIGRLIITKEAPRYPNKKICWHCKCDCGKKKIISTYALRKKTDFIKSCGCARIEKMTESKLIHGFSRRGKHLKEYDIWQTMIRRCYNPNSTSYHNYGERGIEVCKRWREFFPNFLEDMGYRPSDKHSIDRINNDGNYSPKNCHWAINSQQAANKRSNKWIKYKGKSMILADWSRLFKINHANVLCMLKKKTFDEVYEYYMNANRRKRVSKKRKK